ncbi:hypothetical protein L6164_028828 [Bauhinia variegata]|uniref:Uncharacterized protein n=1 Tax=Bauhinia variegata TaxID=167791 RepID=A0ACB9L7C2_BAUVA|nr:hypothetical protein L6164_028828 [Bauhinia variegata]
MAVQEFPASAEKESVPQETPLPTSSSSNSLPLTPMSQDSPLPTSSSSSNSLPLTPTCQDSPLPTSDQLEQLFRHLAMDPLPFFHPSDSNHVLLLADAAGFLVSSINGETSSSSSSGASNGGPSQQEQPLLVLNPTYRVRADWVNRPPPQFYKLNVAVNPCVGGGIGFLGLGIVVRDHFAVVHQALSLVWDHNLNQNVDLAEYYIYSLGIRQCIVCDYRRLIAETESLSLVRQYRQHYNHSRFDAFLARQVSRSDNRLARAFAGLALEFETIFWTRQQILHFFGSLILPF